MSLATLNDRKNSLIAAGAQTKYELAVTDAGYELQGMLDTIGIRANVEIASSRPDGTAGNQRYHLVVGLTGDEAQKLTAFIEENAK